MASGHKKKGAKASGSAEPSSRAAHSCIKRLLRLVLFSGTSAAIDDLVEVDLPTIGAEHLESQIVNRNRFTALGEMTDLTEHETAYGFDAFTFETGIKIFVEFR